MLTLYGVAVLPASELGPRFVTQLGGRLGPLDLVRGRRADDVML
jgi:hypothetical protein